MINAERIATRVEADHYNVLSGGGSVDTVERGNRNSSELIAQFAGGSSTDVAR